MASVCNIYLALQPSIIIFVKVNHDVKQPVLTVCATRTTGLIISYLRIILSRIYRIYSNKDKTHHIA